MECGSGVRLDNDERTEDGGRRHLEVRQSADGRWDQGLLIAAAAAALATSGDGQFALQRVGMRDADDHEEVEQQDRYEGAGHHRSVPQRPSKDTKDHLFIIPRCSRAGLRPFVTNVLRVGVKKSSAKHSHSA